MGVGISFTMVQLPMSCISHLADSYLGHAGAMLQARQLGSELVVGIHPDEAILENKGPTVMTLEERLLSPRSTRLYKLINCQGLLR